MSAATSAGSSPSSAAFARSSRRTRAGTGCARLVRQEVAGLADVLGIGALHRGDRRPQPALALLDPGDRGLRQRPTRAACCSSSCAASSRSISSSWRTRVQAGSGISACGSGARATAAARVGAAAGEAARGLAGRAARGSCACSGGPSPRGAAAPARPVPARGARGRPSRGEPAVNGACGAGAPCAPASGRPRRSGRRDSRPSPRASVARSA